MVMDQFHRTFREKYTQLCRGSKRSQVSTYSHRATCSLAGAMRTSDTQPVKKFMLQWHQATEVSRAEMRGIICALEKLNRAKRGLIIKLCYWIGINIVAGDAEENQRRSLLIEATAELQRHQRQSHELLQEYQRVFDATCQKFHKTSKSKNRLRVRAS